MSGSFTLGTVVGDDLEKRRDDLRLHPDPTRNGIDYVVVDPVDHRRLSITFLRPVPHRLGEPNKDVYGLAERPGERIRISGGSRVVGITAVSARRASDHVIDVMVDQVGDLGTYVLTLDAPELDPPLSTVPLSFAAPCPTDVDCEQVVPCPPATYDEPRIDYLAKDYASFRRLLIDIARSRNPNWNEDNPADLAATVLEALAYEGDRISYFQDAVATEAYLETARIRKSVRRHARLVDYRVHDGRNAWTYVAFTVGGTGTVPQATPVLTRIEAPLAPGATAPPGLVVDPDHLAPLVRPGEPPALQLPAALASVAVFETAHAQLCSERNNEIQIHTWGRDRAALPVGTVEAALFTVDASGTAVRPELSDGQLLLFEEVRGSFSPGRGADADPGHRQVVRIVGSPEKLHDAVYSEKLAATPDGRWALALAAATTDKLPLLRVRWSRADALAFPLCVSVLDEHGEPLRSVAVARGNVALADHGQTIEEDLQPVVPGRTPVELSPSLGPLTVQAPTPPADALGIALVVGRTDLTAPPGACRPAVSVAVTGPTGRTDGYGAVPDLLGSGAFDADLVAEIDDAGFATLRFGDGEYGADAIDGVAFRATYRVGNGPAGNIGADAVAHVALGSPAPPGVPEVRQVRNPLAAVAGTSAESLDAARVAAPEAFRVDQPRAVTEADYAAAAMRLATVQGAVARFRWTGSWWTVFVGIDPADPADRYEAPDGRSRLAPGLTAQVEAHLSAVRQAGYDLALRPPTDAPIELAIDLCVRAGHFRTDVVEAVRVALSRFVLPDGTFGLFHPANWTFGTKLRVSTIYAVVEAVEGVDSLVVDRLTRLGQPDNGELERGVLVPGSWEIVRCDADPNFAEHGTLLITADGGKG